ncbi:uncharacterized protein CPUR_07867 [Claviceps purpurea 20.1]|uniref:Uncharacterized protein n=1 Tax=Claviceps purpurea (strain 20.1) TaxID=1111077 RepID=M1WI65_CLAP2|nr:uncharacterized protein CPUR_07867 [Claviceps purpurea 20.1]
MRSSLCVVRSCDAEPLILVAFTDEDGRDLPLPRPRSRVVFLRDTQCLCLVNYKLRVSDVDLTSKIGYGGASAASAPQQRTVANLAARNSATGGLKLRRFCGTSCEAEHGGCDYGRIEGLGFGGVADRSP